MNKKQCSKNKKGFTLIELLVAVLIIAILTAIAVPQYQKAIMKTKYTTARHYAKIMGRAVDFYHDATGGWPTRIDQLDVDLPGEHYWGTYIFFKDIESCYIWYDGNGNNGYIGCGISDLTHRYRFQQEPKTEVCKATKTNKLANEICQAETGKKIPDSSGDINTYNYP